MSEVAAECAPEVKADALKGGDAQTAIARTEGVLFDMDGVLVSSIGSVVRCWQQWAREYGVPDPDHYEVPHGMRALDIVRSLRPDIDALDGLRRIEDLELADTADLRVLPGVQALLRQLPPERWAIVSSATRRLLVGRLEAAGLPVPEKIISADDVERGKPDPEPYRRGAELLGLTPAECVVIEDAPSGVGAGVAAGSRVLAVLGTHTPEELVAATWLVTSLEQVRVSSSDAGLELRFRPLVVESSGCSADSLHNVDGMQRGSA